METQKFKFFSKKIEIEFCSCPWEKKSSWLRQYQSYISNWCINGKVITSTTAWNPKICYASPSSGEVYRDRQLTTNYELWLKFFVCRHVSLRRLSCWIACKMSPHNGGGRLWAFWVPDCAGQAVKDDCTSLLKACANSFELECVFFLRRRLRSLVEDLLPPSFCRRDL